MHLTEQERDKLLIFVAAELARQRLERGLLLNYPEAVALISSFVTEEARAGARVSEVMESARHILTAEQLMPGAAEMIREVQVEATFPDGTKLVTVHTPIQLGPTNAERSISLPGELTVEPDTSPVPGADTGANRPSPCPPPVIPGEYRLLADAIEAMPHRRRVIVTVHNAGDRPVQVGSHYHFSEVNSALEFDREVAVGFRLDIPSGTAVRFEPGDTKEVTLVAYGGDKQPVGFKGRDGSHHAASHTHGNPGTQAATRPTPTPTQPPTRGRDR